MMSAARIVLFISFVTLGILSNELSSCENVSVDLTANATKSIEDYDDSATSNEEDADIQERYRRLIPYMTYYVLNNYVQQPQQKQIAAAVGPVSPRPRPAAKQRYNLQQTPQRSVVQETGRFVPSVQYNPKEIGSEREVDYFVPVRYGSGPKESTTQEVLPAYEDYGTVRTVRPPPMTITVPEPRYHTSPRPSTNFASQKLKLSPLIKAQEPPLQDYSIYNQAAADEFESVRFATPRPQPALRYPLQQPVAPRPTILEPVPAQAHVSLNNVLKSLQLTNQLPEVLSKDNIDSSIKTLVEILNILNMGKKHLDHVHAYQKPVYTKPKVITETNYQATQISVTPHNELGETDPANDYVNQIKPQMSAPVSPAPLSHHEDSIEISPVKSYIQAQTSAPVPIPTRPPVTDKIVEYYVPIVQDIDVEKPIYNPVKKPSTESPTPEDYNSEEHRDEILEDERFSLPVNTEAPPQNIVPTSLKYGATRGKPHIDYPAYTDIPETNFNCKQQRYKGFFGDPETGCQVWHYCDLNGGKSSFLCPNGTIFSQVALTCDWWFNVKCESTTQLYVLNERLYKYILPVVPKFPEDFSGPEVDKYLELKFREMEAKMKEKKKKKMEQEDKDKDTLNTLQSIEDSK